MISASLFRRPIVQYLSLTIVVIGLIFGLYQLSHRWIFPRAFDNSSPRLFLPSTYYFPYFPVGNAPLNLNTAAGTQGRWNSVLYVFNPVNQPAQLQIKVYANQQLLLEKNSQIPAMGTYEFFPPTELVSQSQILNLEVHSDLAVSPLMRSTLNFANQYQTTALDGVPQSAVSVSKSLPLIFRGQGRNQSDRLETLIYFYNPHDFAAQAEIYFFNQDPYHSVTSQTTLLQPHQTWTINTASLPLDQHFQGSAIINGNVAVTTIIQSDKRLSAYNAISSLNQSTQANFSLSHIISAPGWNWHDTLAVQGHGTGQSPISIQSFDQRGTLKRQQQYTIRPNISTFLPLPWDSSAGLVQINSLDGQPFSALILKDSDVYHGDIFASQSASDLVILPFTGQPDNLPVADWTVRLSNPTNQLMEVDWWQFDRQGTVIRQSRQNLPPHGSWDILPYFPGAGFKFGSMLFQGVNQAPLIVGNSRQEWVRDSRALLAGDGFMASTGNAAPSLPSPTPTLGPINWQTSTVRLQADDFYIQARDQTFSDRTPTVYIDSDPGNPQYTTLEITWQEKNQEMRLYIYFKSDGINWWSDEIRTYGSQTAGQWINYMDGPYFKSNLRQTFQESTFVINSSPQNNPPSVQGTIYFKNLRLQAFINQPPPWKRLLSSWPIPAFDWNQDQLTNSLDFVSLIQALSL